MELIYYSVDNKLLSSCVPKVNYVWRKVHPIIAGYSGHLEPRFARALPVVVNDVWKFLVANLVLQRLSNEFRLGCRY